MQPHETDIDILLPNHPKQLPGRTRKHHQVFNNVPKSTTRQTIQLQRVRYTFPRASTIQAIQVTHKAEFTMLDSIFEQKDEVRNAYCGILSTLTQEIPYDSNNYLMTLDSDFNLLDNVSFSLLPSQSTLGAVKATGGDLIIFNCRFVGFANATVIRHSSPTYEFLMNQTLFENCTYCSHLFSTDCSVFSIQSVHFSYCLDINKIGHINCSDVSSLKFDDCLTVNCTFKHFLSVSMASDLNFSKCSFTQSEILSNPGQKANFLDVIDRDIDVFFEICTFHSNYNSLLSLNLDRANLIIRISHFTNNSALVHSGGALYLYSLHDYSFCHLFNVTFDDNKASSHGGAIAFDSDIDTQVILELCSFDNNYATEANAIFARSVNMTIDACKFFNNINKTMRNEYQLFVELWNSTSYFLNVRSNYGRVRLEGDASTMHLFHMCRFTFDTPSFSKMLKNKPIKSTKSLFSDPPYMIHCDCQYCQFSFLDSSINFDEFISVTNYGGIYLASADGCEISNSEIRSTYAILPSGLYFDSISYLRISECEFYNNTASPATFAHALGTFTTSLNFCEIVNSTFTDCGCSNEYNPMYAISLRMADFVVFLSSSITFSNKNISCGGLLTNLTDDIIIADSEFENCSVFPDNSVPSSIDQAFYGGAINIQSTYSIETINITGSTFISNAALNGHAIWIDIPEARDILIENNIFIDNFHTQRLGSLAPVIATTIGSGSSMLYPNNEFTQTLTDVEIPPVLEFQNGCPMFRPFDSFFIYPKMFNVLQGSFISRSYNPSHPNYQGYNASNGIEAEYVFTGIGCSLYGTSDAFDIYIDGTLASFTKLPRSDIILPIFNSSELQYGEHRFRIVVKGPMIIYGLKIWTDFYNDYVPVPSMNNYHQWTQVSNETTGTSYISSNSNYRLTVSLLTNRFELVGLQGRYQGELQASYDSTSVTVPLQLGTVTRTSYYKSDPSDFSVHNFAFTALTGTACLDGLLYQTFIGYTHLDPTWLIYDNEHQWVISYNSAKTTTVGQSFKYYFCGTEFKIYGGEMNGRIKIELDGSLFATTDINQGTFSSVLIFDSTQTRKPIKYANHDVTVTLESGSALNVTQFSYLLTSPIPSVRPMPTMQPRPTPNPTPWPTSTPRPTPIHDLRIPTQTPGTRYPTQTPMPTRTSLTIVVSETPEPPPITNSEIFSASAQFSSSSSFSPSPKFATAAFTNSNTFTKSIQFTQSSEFTKSSEFTASFIFTPTFSNSDVFSHSDDFTFSQFFTEYIGENGDSSSNGKSEKEKKKTQMIIIGTAVGGTVIVSVIAILATLFACPKPLPVVPIAAGDETDDEITDPLAGIDAPSSSSLEYFADMVISPPDTIPTQEIDMVLDDSV